MRAQDRLRVQILISNYTENHPRGGAFRAPTARQEPTPCAWNLLHGIGRDKKTKRLSQCLNRHVNETVFMRQPT